MIKFPNFKHANAEHREILANDKWFKQRISNVALEKFTCLINYIDM